MISLGLDIGTSSIGFAISYIDEKNKENSKILEYNSVIFQKKEVKVGKNATISRREARQSRRLLKRKKQRMRNVLSLLYRYGFITKTQLKNPKQYFSEIQRNTYTNLFESRYQALRKLLPDQELVRILYSFAKRRGYSTRYDENEMNENGIILKQLKKIKKDLSRYETFGEMIYSKYLNGELNKFRNSKKSNYENLQTFSDVKHEIKTILKKQQEFGNKKVTDEMIEELISNEKFNDGSVSLFYQRPLKNIESMIGYCTFDYLNKTKRAPKASFQFLKYTFLEKLHNITLDTGESLYQNLTKDLDEAERVEKINSIFELFIENNGTFNKTFIKKLTKEKTNIDKQEASMSKYAIDLYLKIKELNFNLFQYIEDIAYITTVYLDKDEKKNKLKEKIKNITDEELDILSNLSYSEFGKLGLSTMINLNQAMMDGLNPYESKKMLGYTINQSNKINFLPPLSMDDNYIKNVLKEKIEKMNNMLKNMSKSYIDIDGIDFENFNFFLYEDSNPVVNRVLSNLRMVINTIIEKYGVPDQIIVELARDFNTKKEKKRYEENVKKNQKKKKNAEKFLKEYFKNEIERDESNIHKYINRKNIERYLLWEEQNHKCVYSFEEIKLEQLFDKQIVEVDHVLPRSKIIINANKNKVVVFSKENQEKSNLYHYDYLKQKGKWKKFVEFVNATKMDNNKKEWLKNEDFLNISSDSFINDTKYVSKVVAKYLRFYLYDEENAHKVKTINGRTTALLRREYNLPEKSRENFYHHSIDAIVLSFITDKTIYNISKYYQKIETKKQKDHKMIFPYENFVKDIEKVIENYKNNKKIVYHVIKKPKKTVAYNNPIATKLLPDKNGNIVDKIIKRKFIQDIYSDFEIKADKNKEERYGDIEKKFEEIKHLIVDNSPDKIILSNILTYFKELSDLHNELNTKNKILKDLLKIEKTINSNKNLSKDKKEKELNFVISNIEKIKKENEVLIKKINYPMVVFRGKKRTKQYVKQITMLTKQEDTLKTFNLLEKNGSKQKRQNKNTSTLFYFIAHTKNSKGRVVVKCYTVSQHDVWNKTYEDILNTHQVMKLNQNNMLLFTNFESKTQFVKKFNGVDGISLLCIDPNHGNKGTLKNKNIERFSLKNHSVELVNFDIFGNVKEIKKTGKKISKNIDIDCEK